MKTDRSSKRLKINIISRSFYQILVMIVPIITTPYVTRIFDVSQIGDYSLSLTIASLFVVISQFGIETYGSRKIAKSENNLESSRIYFQLLSIQFVVSLIMFLLYNIIFVLLLDLGNKQLYFIQSLLILVNIFDISWFFIGIEEIRKTIYRNALTKIFTTLSILILIKKDSQLELYALINILGMFFGNLVMVLMSKNYINYGYRKFEINKEHFKKSFKLLVPRLLSSSKSSFNKSILKISTTSVNVGIFSESTKIIDLIFSVINSGFSALSPRMSYYVSRKEFEKVHLIFEKGLLSCLAFSIIFVSGIQAIASDFVDFFYGTGYEEIGNVLKVASFALVFIPIISLLNRGILIPLGKDKEYSFSIVIILISGIILNLLLDPVFGAVGAALAYCLTEFFSFLYLIYVSRTLIKSVKVINNIILSLIAISLNNIIIDFISKKIFIENSFYSFVVFGLISIVISVINISIILWWKRFSYKGNLFFKKLVNFFNYY